VKERLHSTKARSSTEYFPRAAADIVHLAPPPLPRAGRPITARAAVRNHTFIILIAAALPLVYFITINILFILRL